MLEVDYSTLFCFFLVQFVIVVIRGWEQLNQVIDVLFNSGSPSRHYAPEL